MRVIRNYNIIIYKYEKKKKYKNRLQVKISKSQRKRQITSFPYVCLHSHGSLRLSYVTTCYAFHSWKISYNMYSHFLNYVLSVPDSYFPKPSF